VKHNATLGHPANDRLLIEIAEAPEKTAGGIFIAPSVQANMEQRSGRGTILDAGLSALDTMRSYGWEIGDEITFGKFSPVYLEGSEWEDAEKRKRRALVINVGDVFTNISLAGRLNDGSRVLVYERLKDGTHQHAIWAEKPTTKNGEIHAAAV